MFEIRNKDDKARICFFFYYSGHGCTFEGSNMSTHMVMINEADGYFPIEDELKKLSRKSNISVASVLDCCRITI
jgi:hypothetical protein